MATYRYARIPAQRERIEYSGQMLGAAEVSASTFGDQVIRSMAA